MLHINVALCPIYINIVSVILHVPATHPLKILPSYDKNVSLDFIFYS